MPNAFAILATRCPIWPSPNKPSVLSFSSVPICLALSQAFSVVTLLVACGICLAIESIKPIVISATASAFAPGVLVTHTPRLVHASTSTGSTPAP